MSTIDAPTRPPTHDPPPPPDDFDLRGGRNRRNLLAAAGAAVVVVVVLVVLLAGGSSTKTVAGSHFGTTLPVAYEADSNSERAFLQWLNTAIAPKYGIKIEPRGIEDGNQLDAATAEGQIAANIYQHIHWLNEVVQATGMKLTAIGPVFQWAYSIYSSKYKSLAALPEGAQVALLNDPANTAQALWLLERAGEITFKPGTVPWSATTSEIASNPHHLHFVFIDYGAGPRTLGSVDAVIAYNMQFISAGIPESDKIYAPPAPRSFAGQLVVGTQYRNDPQVKKLIKVFFDPRVQPYLSTTQNPQLKDQLDPVAAPDPSSESIVG
jgi:D-methionine transport system substrate-binding protein